MYRLLILATLVGFLVSCASVETPYQEQLRMTKELQCTTAHMYYVYNDHTYEFECTKNW